MLVTLAQLKIVLGIGEDDTTEDARLTLIIDEVSAWVQNECRCRFDTPIPRTEIMRGNGEREIYINGHIDDSAADSDDPLPITVSRRAYGSFDSWELLVAGQDYERRDQMFVSGYPIWCLLGWSPWDEYQFEYPDGYVECPKDIQQLILEMASGQYTTDIDLASGTTGVTSEKLGDYSYTVDLGATAAGTAGGGTTSVVGSKTIQRYKRKFV